MRVVLVVASLLVLAACSGDPRSFGITGPGTQPPPPVGVPADSPDASPTPGVPVTGSYYGQSHGPTAGESGFWGYNN